MLAAIPDKSSFEVGIIGFGAFGQLIARHVGPHFRLCAHDPAPGLQVVADQYRVALASLEQAARCPIVVLAVPVASIQAVVHSIAPLLRRGALVLDVGSVKTIPADIMRRSLPGHVDVVATHPLFGPQSARNGIAGLKIAVCPVRGRRCGRVAAFFRKRLKLDVILTTPEAHDREAAVVQGLTHLVAKVLVAMDPLPSRMTTRSFEHLLQATDMVRHDAPEVFDAIERLNPFAADVRRRFFCIAAELDAHLASASGIRTADAGMAQKAKVAMATS